MKEMTHLKTRLVECDNPVGIKKTSNWKLPPIDFLYGKKEKEDPEGVSINYRKNVNIKRKIPQGTNERRIYLPSEDFIYGRKNRTPTPVKDVINYEYAKKAEEVIKLEYGAYMSERSRVDKIIPKTTKHFTNKLLSSKKNSQQQEKPLYKLKMFKDVDSKVKENLKTFKTYNPRKDNIDNLIDKVENELRGLDNDEQLEEVGVYQ